jgi:putative oxidoreductase
MAVAVAMIHHQFGLFMNWTGTQKGEGFEFHLLVLAITLFLMIRGAGAASISSPANNSIRTQARTQAA